jgi:hypothetical protein
MKKILTPLLFCFLLTMFSMNNQLIRANDSGRIFFESNQDDEKIKTLIEQRAELVHMGKSTRSVDLELSQLGHLPEAVISYAESLPITSHVNLSFPYYREIQEDRKERIAQRIISLYSNIISLTIDTVNYKIEVVLSSTPTDTDLLSLVKLFGYNGYITRS